MLNHYNFYWKRDLTSLLAVIVVALMASKGWAGLPFQGGGGISDLPGAPPTRPLTTDEADTVQKAIDVIKCMDQGTGDGRGDRLQDLLDNGDLLGFGSEASTGESSEGNSRDREQEGGASRRGIAYGGEIAVDTQDGVITITGTLTHEVEHHDNAAAAGTPGDPTTDPRVVGKEAGSLAHAAIHKRQADFLCALSCSDCLNLLGCCAAVGCDELHHKYFDAVKHQVAGGVSPEVALAGPPAFDRDTMQFEIDCCCVKGHSRPQR